MIDGEFFECGQRIKVNSQCTLAKQIQWKVKNLRT